MFLDSVFMSAPVQTFNYERGGKSTLFLKVNDVELLNVARCEISIQPKGKCSLCVTLDHGPLATALRLKEFSGVDVAVGVKTESTDISDHLYMNFSMAPCIAETFEVNLGLVPAVLIRLHGQHTTEQQWK